MTRGAQPPKGRLGGVDAFRIGASLSTVWIHATAITLLEPLGAFGRWAVPYFCFIAGLFLVAGVARAPDRGIPAYARERFFRLYTPFLFWTAVYLAARSIKRAVFSDEPPIELGFFRLLSGSSEHLWFLPFLLLASVLVFPLVRWAYGHERREAVVGLAGVFIGLAIAMASAPRWFSYFALDSTPLSIEYFLSRTWNRAPSFVWGVSLGLLWRFRPSKMRLSAAEAATGGAVALACLVYLWAEGRNSALENLAGLGMSVLAFGPWPERFCQRAAAYGGISYGVYLAHPLFVQVGRAAAQLLAPRVALGHITETWWYGLALFAFGAVGAITFSLLVRRSRYTRWVIADRGPAAPRPDGLPQAQRASAAGGPDSAAHSFTTKAAMRRLHAMHDRDPGPDTAGSLVNSNRAEDH